MLTRVWTKVELIRVERMEGLYVFEKRNKSL